MKSYYVTLVCHLYDDDKPAKKIQLDQFCRLLTQHHGGVYSESFILNGYVHPEARVYKIQFSSRHEVEGFLSNVPVNLSGYIAAFVIQES